MKNQKFLLQTIFLILPFLFQLFAGIANAAVFNCSTVDCLIDSINQANWSTEADVINLTPGVFLLYGMKSFVEGANGLPVIIGTLTINGGGLDGQGNPITTIERTSIAKNEFRIFHIAANGNLTLNRLSIIGGNAGNHLGGAISNLGVIKLIWCQVKFNGAFGSGGIDNRGTATLLNTTVAVNLALNGGGGGIFNNGTLTIFSSTVNENTGEVGGGILNNGVIKATNCTISKNKSNQEGAGIWNAGNSSMITLQNVTVTENASTFGSALAAGGGIANLAGGTVSLVNTIVAGNKDLSGTAPDCGGNLTSQGHNLIGNKHGCSFTAASGDIVGTAVSPVDPKLDVLKDDTNGNGGPQTQALLSGSPAIDKGSKADCPFTDERNFVRPTDGNGDGISACDIGAFERNAKPACGSVISYSNGQFIVIPLPATIVGTANADTLNGTSGPDRIHGLGGNDVIKGNGGNDIICGGTGADTIQGGDGNDTLYGDDDNDSINGDSGDDLLIGGWNSDICNGGTTGEVNGDKSKQCETNVDIP